MVQEAVKDAGGVRLMIGTPQGTLVAYTRSTPAHVRKVATELSPMGRLFGAMFMEVCASTMGRKSNLAAVAAAASDAAYVAHGCKGMRWCDLTPERQDVLPDGSLLGLPHLYDLVKHEGVWVWASTLKPADSIEPFRIVKRVGP